MNTELLIKAGINYEEGLSRVLNDKSLYEEILKAFISDSLLDRTKRAYEGKNASELFACIHELKGVTANISITKVYKKSSELTELLRSGIYDVSEVDRKYHELQLVLEEAVNAIKEALND